MEDSGKLGADIRGQSLRIIDVVVVEVEVDF